METSSARPGTYSVERFGPARIALFPHEPHHDCAVAALDRCASAVLALAHHGRAADQYCLHHLAAADEDVGIEPGIVKPPDEVRMVGVEDDDVGAPAGRERADASAERLRAANKRPRARGAAVRPDAGATTPP